jgi:hypothetical protein
MMMYKSLLVITMHSGRRDKEETCYLIAFRTLLPFVGDNV